MSITKSVFGTMPDGSEVLKYKIQNAEGCFAEFITYGATWLSAFMYDKNNTISTLSVDKFVVNKPIEDSLFIFNATQYPNVFINDMR